MTTKETEFICKEPAFRIAAKIWNPHLSKNIFAFHGWMDNAASFDFLAPLLADRSLIAYDLPGHGRSTRASSYCYHLTEYFLAMYQLLESERHPILMGHSLGGALASMYAGVFPEKIRALILLDGLGPLTEDESLLPERLARFLQLRTRSEGPERPVSRDAVIRRRMEINQISFASAEALMDRNLIPAVEDMRTWSMDLTLRLPSPFRFTESQVLSVLRKIACPTLLIKTDEEQGLSAFLESRRPAVKTLEIVEVKGCHHVHMEQPKMVADIIQSFLKKHDL
ncbi:MAG: alpha/beta fold hydrolase [Oligoflexales bacterium]